jgi:hypothetical protein
MIDDAWQRWLGRPFRQGHRASSWESSLSADYFTSATVEFLRNLPSEWRLGFRAKLSGLPRPAGDHARRTRNDLSGYRAPSEASRKYSARELYMRSKFPRSGGSFQVGEVTEESSAPTLKEVHYARIH